MSLRRNLILTIGIGVIFIGTRLTSRPQTKPVSDSSSTALSSLPVQKGESLPHASGTHAGSKTASMSAPGAPAVAASAPVISDSLKNRLASRPRPEEVKAVISLMGGSEIAEELVNYLHVGDREFTKEEQVQIRAHLDARVRAEPAAAYAAIEQGLEGVPAGAEGDSSRLLLFNISAGLPPHPSPAVQSAALSELASLSATNRRPAARGVLASESEMQEAIVPLLAFDTYLNASGSDRLAALTRLQPTMQKVTNRLVREHFEQTYREALSGH